MFGLGKPVNQETVVVMRRIEMCDAQPVDEKKPLVDFISKQFEQKVKQVENATSLYFKSLLVLAAGVGSGLTGLAGLKSAEDTVKGLVYFGIPSFLIAWFGCYLFIYWEHHMLRIGLDYAEKRASQELGVPDDEIFLYHADFLGIFNEAPFRVKSISVKLVQVVFVIIAVPAFLLYGWAGVMAHGFIQCLGWYVLYASALIVFPLVLIGIHIKCVSRERKFKEKLKIISRVKGDPKDWTA